MLLRPSEKRVQASRANGARSQGPKTPEGKGRSSRNAVRHGLLSSPTDPQSLAAFARLLDDYTARFRPSGEVQAGLVRQLAAAVFQRRRILEFEKALPASADLHQLLLLQRYDLRLARIQQRLLHALYSAVPSRLSQTNPKPPVFPTNPSETNLRNRS